MIELIVDSLEDTSINDGKTTLREALVIANRSAEEHTITFDDALAGGTITLGGTQLLIKSNITIDGDTNGDDVADITISGNGESRVLQIESGTATINSLKVTGGYELGTSAESGDHRGGGIAIDRDATVFINDSAIIGNTANIAGGIYNYGTTVIRNTEISGNTAIGNSDDGGGAVIGGVQNYGKLNLIGSLISENTSDYGGAISASGGRLNIVNSIISDNNGSTTSGGIIFWSNGSIKNSIISGNDGPGVIDRSDEIVNIRDSTISGNSANMGGGIFSESSGTTNVTDSTISGNFGFYGGGIFNYNGGTVNVNNTTISGNSATHGGAIGSFSEGVISVKNSTISGNSASVASGGIYSNIDSSGRPDD